MRITDLDLIRVAIVIIAGVAALILLFLGSDRRKPALMVAALVVAVLAGIAGEIIKHHLYTR